MYINKKYIFISAVVLIIISGGIFLSSLSAQKKVSGEDKENSPQTFYFTPPPLPEMISFAGEPVPLHHFEVRESLDRELLSVSNFHSQTLLMLKKLPRYFQIIEPILKKNKIPEDFKFLALAESSFLDKAMSPAGAIGIWQFMKEAAVGNGLEVNAEVDERFHIEKSTQAACNYLNDAYGRYRSWTMAAASYNAGLNGMNRQISLQNSQNYYDLLLNEETARYIFRILALKLVLSDPEKYGFRVAENEKYPVIPVKLIEVGGSINDLAVFAQSHKINYKLLKYFNPWLRQPELKNPRNKKYFIKIPQPGFREVVSDENPTAPEGKDLKEGR